MRNPFIGDLIQDVASTSGRQETQLTMDWSSVTVSRDILNRGRGLHNNITSNQSFMWAMIAIGATVGALILVGVALIVYYCCKKDNKVQPSESKMEQVQPSHELEYEPVKAPVDALKAAPVNQGPAPTYGGPNPTPPWEQTGSMPPGIMMAPQIPLNFQPYVSNPRPPGAPPYDRLLLISSRVNDPLKVAAAALPNVAVVVYDWKNFTFQEVVRYIKKALGTAKVTSLAVIAPGNKPGAVDILDGNLTTAEKLQERGEVLQFWRVLSGCVAASGTNDGKRVDLIGCRVVEAPREGASLLKELWSKTAVPFAAADDALGGYMLATFLEEPNTGSMSLISSTIQGIDLYFNRNILLGLQPPPQSQQYSSVPAAQVPQYAAIVQSAPPDASSYPPPPAVVPPPSIPGTTSQDDVFQRFTARVAALGYTLPDVFKKYDVDKSGQLTQPQVIAMLKDILPDASNLDTQHFQAMMDIDGNHMISQQEFLTTLQQNKDVHSQVKSGKDDNALMQQLHDYLTDNEAILQEYFSQADKDKSGKLDHAEVAAFVQSIPDLTPEEQKFIISYLYQSDKDSDGKLTFNELKAVIASFGPQKAKVTVAQSIPVAESQQQPQTSANNYNGYNAPQPVAAGSVHQQQPPPGSYYPPSSTVPGR